MIPPAVHTSCASGGERDVFERLRSDPGTHDWVVLHSLDVARHERQVAGEIDFVVIVPGLGVVRLEVKGCRTLRRADGLWYYGAGDTAGDARGPFKQAADAMHSLRRRVVRHAPALAGVVFWSAVALPYVPFDVASEGWHPWQVIDGAAFRRTPVARLIARVLDGARHHLAGRPGAGWFDPATAGPTPEQRDLLVRLLRPDFEVYESPRARVPDLDAAAKQYTEEQFAAFDAMAANPRVVFEGPAGTGKTLLAVEAARREHAEGRRVLLVCFNRLLGQWLEREVAPLAPGVRAGTLHRYMLSVAGLGTAPPGAGPAYWEETLPAAAADVLLRDDAPPGGFDAVIVDEAQDVVLRGPYLDVLDMSLHGGLAAGRWRWFGDFERQAIYGAPGGGTPGGAGAALGAVLERRTPGVPRFGLRVNCRNTPRIAEWVQLLGGLAPGYRRVCRPDDGVDPDIVYYRTPGEQAIQLGQALDTLAQAGFRGTDVVVLSPRAGPASAAAGLPPGRVLPLGEGGPFGGPARYGSVHAFKGLEAKAVVVTDVEQVGDAQAAALLYVATTRALHRLVILANARVKQEARALIRQRLGAGHTA